MTCKIFQVIIRPVSNPIKETGHIQILRGDLAPEGSVAKITGKEGLYFSGNADSLSCPLTPNCLVKHFTVSGFI